MKAARILLSWWRTRRAMRLPRTQLEQLRAAKWRALQPALLATPALRQHAGKALAQYPLAGQADVRTDYGRWNSIGLSHEECAALADAAERGEDTGEIVAGWSTGTGGGARGLFLTDSAERADYLGQSIARLLPTRALLKRQRIALHLRANNALYTDVRGQRIGFAHFPIDIAPAETSLQISSYDPTILIAPPHRLIALAGSGIALPSLTHLFYGSEPMSAAEQDYVAAQFGHFPKPIWQATEGFLASACSEGRLHLNDHALEVELEPVSGTRGFRPIVTDLHRRSQPVVRLRGDDFVELDPRGPNPCGFAGRTILPVAGRVADLWRFGDETIVPRQVIEAVESELGGAIRWQAIAGPHGVTLRADPDCPPDLLERAAERLSRLVPVPLATACDLPEWPGPKRRKVICADG